MGDQTLAARTRAPSMMKLLRYGSKFEQILFLQPKFYEKLAHNFYWSMNSFDVDKFEIDPLKITSVDPKNIQRVTGRRWKPWSELIQKIGQVSTGDWDKTNPTELPDEKKYPKEFDQHTVHQAFLSHFEKGISWKETSHYQKKLEKAESDQEFKHIKMKLNQYDNLYKSINKTGYKSQIQLCGPSNTFIDTRLGEILVDIGRDGEILFVDGRHRLSIAKILGLDSIPVFILVRHEKWCNSKH